MKSPVSDARAIGLEDSANWSNVRLITHGWGIALRVPGCVLLVSSMGYGALARDAGLDLALTLYINALFFALPAQVVLVDQIARGAALAGAAFAVALTAIRLLPMTVSLMPLLRDDEKLNRFTFLATHFVAISVWVDGVIRLPMLPPSKRLIYFIGMGLGMMSATLTGSAIGYTVSSSVPSILAAALLFMSPSFFLLSQIGSARTGVDLAAVALGAALGPMFYIIAPGLDLLLAGAFGGTIAFVLSKRSKLK